MSIPAVNQTLRDVAAEVLARHNFELVHAEVAGPKHNPLFTVFIDKPGGITLDDCGKASREIEALLDEVEHIPETYVLEVSSPGIERGLYSLADFERFKGQEARLRLKMPVDGRRNVTGMIGEVKGSSVIIAEAGEPIEVAFDSIKKANLKVDLDQEIKNSKPADK
jgi:ribosome maturation factor RimP